MDHPQAQTDEYRETVMETWVQLNLGVIAANL